MFKILMQPNFNHLKKPLLIRYVQESNKHRSGECLLSLLTDLDWFLTPINLSR